MLTPRCRLVALALAAVVAVGCGEKKERASQTAARVDREEVTVQQISFVLQQRNVRPEQTESASRQVLERLIDQQLALQKAEELKLDRDPRVVQQLDAARREVLARAYVEKVGEAATKPTPDEVKKYYDDKPGLFKDRRIYNLQEIAIEARPEQLGALREALGQAKTTADFIEHLKSNDYRFGANQAVRAAEQVPLQNIDTLSRMKDGQAVLTATPTGATVVVLAGSRSQPIDEERARPVIEQYLLNERRRKLVEEDVKAMRAAAKIEYVGKFAVPAPAGAASVPVPASGSGASDSDSGKGSGPKK
ncbi:peptidyl-prolyl cis-trans isomerase, EpsD family [Aquincola sp. S2]|uniref:Peptidyl-prolyl cis-trans isomerase, EpsD family n=1 Tax=Pseudaquabacterium terrae TaxID=2732868 RepID=A0ABX2EK95_9BURK|nr:EpsD family peptidyl-prolyl cis-trans isomerase [Aquabacterium terrae]NRF69081.1 peptidyl-prolyl cis-trans isomerase, EpsD family [Aquabacterium terrae]